MTSNSSNTAGFTPGFSQADLTSRIPVWDNNPKTFAQFKHDVKWWLAGEDLTVTTKYNIAVRFVNKQNGLAKLKGQEFDPPDIAYKPEVSMPNMETGDDEVVTPADYTYGIWKVVNHMETLLAEEQTEKKANLRDQFHEQLSRRAGESIVSFSARFN